MGSIGVFAINPALYKDLGCYPLKDYDLLSVAVRTPNAPDHLTAALFWQKTGTTGIHVPYEGGSAAHLDLIAGNATCRSRTSAPSPGT